MLVSTLVSTLVSASVSTLVLTSVSTLVSALVSTSVSTLVSVHSVLEILSICSISVLHLLALIIYSLALSLSLFIVEIFVESHNLPCNLSIFSSCFSNLLTI